MVLGKSTIGEISGSHSGEYKDDFFWDEITLIMEAASTSDTLVNFYHTTRRYNPEDSHLRTHRRENLKS
jgi:hypothetical protein